MSYYKNIEASFISLPQNRHRVFKEAYKNAVQDSGISPHELGKRSTSVAWEMVKAYYSRNRDVE